MRRVTIGSGLYIIAGALLIVWSIEYFGYNSGEHIHVLLVVAIVLLLIKTFMHLPPGWLQGFKK